MPARAAISSNHARPAPVAGAFAVGLHATRLPTTTAHATDARIDQRLPANAFIRLEPLGGVLDGRSIRLQTLRVDQRCLRRREVAAADERVGDSDPRVDARRIDACRALERR